MGNKILTLSIAAYNVEIFLRDTLNSLICTAENMEQLEVFIVDDGSNDGTLEIAEEYASKWPHTFFPVKKENGGHGSTLNYSMKHARGKYFKMLDGDDWLNTEELSRYIKILEDSSADIVLSPYKRIYEDGSPDMVVSRHKLNENKIYDIDHLGADQLKYIHAAELAVKTVLLQDKHVEIKEKSFYTDDEYVFFSCLYASTVLWIPECLYCYRIGIDGQSVSLEGMKRNWKDPAGVITHILHRCIPTLDHITLKKRDLLYSGLLAMTEFQFHILMNIEYSPDLSASVLNFINELRNFQHGFWEYVEERCYIMRLLLMLYLAEAGAPCVIWGAGHYGAQALPVLLTKGAEVKAVVDNDSSRWEEQMENVPILSPKEAVKRYKTASFFIVVKNHEEEIREELLNLGIEEESIFITKGQVNRWI